MAGGPDLRYDNITVQAPVDGKVALGAHKTVLFAMIQPMSCPSSSDYSKIEFSFIWVEEGKRLDPIKQCFLYN